MKVNRTGATAVIRLRSSDENGREGTPDGASLPRPARIATSGAVPAGSNLDTGSYFYDGAGNITAMGGDVFGYDRLSRLTSGNLSGLGNQGFSYDRYGNLTGTTGVNPRSYSVNNQNNRLTNASYDSRGNLLTIGSETYTWDALDRTTRYQAPSSVDWKYLYDGVGERLVKIPASGATSDYVWTFRDQGNRVATEYIGPIVSRDNVYFGNLLVGSYASCAANGPPGWTYYSSDHLGTPRLITDASGNVLDGRKYWPYGDEASVTQPTSSQRLRFAGMERDPEGNRYHDHARSYDFQTVGRFLSVDLLRGSPNAPQSLNRYSYVFGNPINLTDPFGLQAEEFGSEFTGEDPRTGQRISGRFTAFHGSPGDFGTVYSGSFENGYFIYSAIPEGRVTVEETCYCELNINLQGLAAVQRGTRLAKPVVYGAAIGTGAIIGGSLIAATSGPLLITGFNARQLIAAGRAAAIVKALYEIAPRDAGVIRRAIELARQSPPGLLEDRIALSRALAEAAGPRAKVLEVMTSNGPAWIGLANRIGITAMNGATYVVRVSLNGEIVRVFGPLR